MRGYVDTRWGQVHYERHGTDGPVVALFHETPLSLHAFGRLAEALAADFQVIAFDTPGYGESDPPPGESAPMEEYGATIAEALDALGIDRVALYGTHTGASLALELAARLGDRATALVVNGLPFYTDEVRAKKVVPPVPDFADDGGHLSAVWHWEPDAYAAEPRGWLTSGVSKHADRAYQAFHAVYTYVPARRFAAITCPVLVLSNPLDPLYDADNRFAAALPRARQVVVESDRLPIYYTKTETVAGLVADLVRAVADEPSVGGVR